MKTVIVTMPMKKEVYKLKYPVQGNKSIEYDGGLQFPVNGVLARTLKPGEKVKLIFIVTRGNQDHGFENVELFKTEFSELNKDIRTEFVDEIIELPFDPSKEVFNKLITELITKIGQDSEIIADFTFGGKPFPFVLLCALNFAESFHNASILYLIYGKVEFKPEPSDPMLYDVTSLYYLQKLIGAMQDRSKDTASKMLADFFAL
ncbi:TM1812 family CRISPR-associated protein [Treponema primitia]|uniref:TM1812 family CRISPR-associated protein n=1 Tax=Treponema primitia TaxID=88058 RepID=UPI0002554E47|nr:TM1812 family CRISPR-associated protein [Treponema primitia]